VTEGERVGATPCCGWSSISKTISFILNLSANSGFADRIHSQRKMASMDCQCWLSAGHVQGARPIRSGKYRPYETSTDVCKFTANLMPKFRADRSNRCRDRSIHRFFKTAAVRDHLWFYNFEILTANNYVWQNGMDSPPGGDAPEHWTAIPGLDFQKFLR